jgi:hypothetical protein
MDTHGLAQELLFPVQSLHRRLGWNLWAGKGKGHLQGTPGPLHFVRLRQQRGPTLAQAIERPALDEMGQLFSLHGHAAC